MSDERTSSPRLMIIGNSVMRLPIRALPWAFKLAGARCGTAKSTDAYPEPFVRLTESSGTSTAIPAFAYIRRLAVTQPIGGFPDAEPFHELDPRSNAEHQPRSRRGLHEPDLQRQRPGTPLGSGHRPLREE